MRRSGPVAAVLVTVLAATLAGCGDTTDPGQESSRRMRVYGTDGIMQNSIGDELAERSILSGVKGTAPGGPLPTSFTNRMRELEPDLSGFLFAGETYDAVVISALAAELAGTPDPRVVRQYINGVTTGGQECRSPAECLELARAGIDLAYRGVSLRAGGFTDAGEPAAATYATMHFGRDGYIDDSRTEYLSAGDVTATTTEEPPPPNPNLGGGFGQPEPLRLGGLLPETGDLAIAYPPLITAVRLAIQDINDAGGVFGVDVEWFDGDDGTDPEVARRTLAAHVEDGVHILIGAAASGVSEAILPDVIAAERILFAPSNTAADLGADDDGYYFRTAPSDELQGTAVADVVLRDGTRRVAIVARDDAYGRGLQQNTREALLRYGMPEEDLHLFTYAVPGQAGLPLPGLDRLIDDLTAAGVDGVVVIGFAEAAQLIQRLHDEGLLYTLD